MISMPVVQDIRKLARGGSTVAEISRETGVSEPTVRKYIRKTCYLKSRGKPEIFDRNLEK